MIISHKHKFIFIKTLKTAGTSIEIALSKICGENDIITPIKGVDERYRRELGYPGKQNYYFPLSTYSKIDILKSFYHLKRLGFYNHISAANIKNRVSSDVWNDYYKFCFERNPFDKAISWFYYRGRRGPDKFTTIKDFIKAGKMNDVSGFELYTIDSLPVVDKVYKFENLAQSIDDINKKLKLDNEIVLPKKRTKGNIRKDKRHYREVLTEYESKWISIIFARELAFLNYEY